MHKTDIKNFKIKDYHLVALTKMNHISEIQYMQKRNNKATIKKIDKYNYVHLESGELREFKKHADTRTAHINSMYRTMKQLRYLINNNFTGAKNEKFITFTFKKQTKDHKLVYSEFDKFIKRLRYYFKDKSSIDYLSVIEPHATGNFHLHVLFRFNDVIDIGFIDNKVIADIWGNGFTKTKDIEKVDNIGAYLSAYLADMPLKEIPEKEKQELLEADFKDVKGECIVKGARLHYYPKGIRIYRSSRGIKKPTREVMPYLMAKEKQELGALTYSKTIEINLPNNKTNILSYEYYNTKRG